MGDFCWIQPPPKNWVPSPLLWSQTAYWKKGISLGQIAFRQILPKFFLATYIFSCTSITYLKSSLKVNPNTKLCLAGSSPKVILLYPPSDQKCPLLWCCFVAPTMCGLSPLRPSLFGKPWGWGRENPTQQPKRYSFPSPEIAIFM